MNSSLNNLETTHLITTTIEFLLCYTMENKTNLRYALRYVCRQFLIRSISLGHKLVQEVSKLWAKTAILKYRLQGKNQNFKNQPPTENRITVYDSIHRFRAKFPTESVFILSSNFKSREMMKFFLKFAIFGFIIYAAFFRFNQNY